MVKSHLCSYVRLDLLCYPDISTWPWRDIALLLQRLTHSIETWQLLCNICVVWGTYSRPVRTQTLGDTRHSEPLQWKTFFSYTTQQRTTGRSPFLSRSGPYPVLTACCDKINQAGTLRSALCSDPLITVPPISVVQCSVVQHNAMWHSAVRHSEMQHSVVQWLPSASLQQVLVRDKRWTLHYSVVHYSVVQHSAVRHSEVQHSVVQWLPSASLQQVPMRDKRWSSRLGSS